MGSANTCRECGAVIPSGSPPGFCPRCLLAFAFKAEGGQALEAGFAELDQPAQSAQLPPAAMRQQEQVGEMVGRYKLLERIGQGGFGVVYMAAQREPVKRRVALKIIKLGMDTRQVVARFEAERQALALMDHPNIARILDAGATDTGRPFFVMELVRGTKITDYCDQNALPTRGRLALFIQVCRAIQHAHQKGIIHRDIKPSNILVTLHDGVPVPKVIDFGIAKATQQELTEQTVFTQFRHFIGTPAYMSPEQAEMSGLDIDTRTDIYALGALLYELLTGKTPFDTKELLAAGLEDVRRTIREKEPIRPSSRLSTLLAGDLATTAKQHRAEPPKLIHAVRGDLDWIVMKCLEKDRTRRYETANGLAVDVERHLRNEPVVARPQSKRYRLQKMVRRHKLACAAVAGIAAALIGGTWQAIRAARAEREQGRLRLEAERAKRDATGRLWDSYLVVARARRSGQAGQRFESLAALSNAAAIRPSLELRNEAIACMALADIRVVAGSEKSFKLRQEFATTDAALERYAFRDRTGAVTIRRVSDDQELTRLPSPAAAAAAALAFSPDGRFVHGGYVDGRRRFWDVATGKLQLEVPTLSVGFSPDSKRVVALEDDVLVIYDVGTWQKIRTIPRTTSITDLGPFHPDGRLLVLYDEEDTNVVILDTKSGKSVTTLVHPGPVYDSAWHPGGKYLATACEDNLLYLWDTKSGQLVRTLAGHQGTPVCVAFNHEGSLLASAGWDARIRLWDFRTGRQLVSILRSGFFDFSPDDQTLVTHGWDCEQLCFFQVASGAEARPLHTQEQVYGAPRGTACFDSKGSLLAFATTEGITLWDPRAGREIASLKGDGMAIAGFDAQDANLLLEIGSKGLFRLPTKLPLPAEWASVSSPILANPEGHSSAGLVSADGRLCAVQGEDGRCRVFRTDTFALQARTDVQRGMRFVAISPNGNLIATGAWHANGVKVWDARTGELRKDLATQGYASTVAFSPDGCHLVIGTGSECCFWEVGSWRPGLRLAQADNDFLPLMAFSHDGLVFAASHSMNVVRLFNAATGEVFGDLEPPSSWQVTGVAFSPDGTQLAVCEGLHAVHLWDLRAIRQQLASMGLDWNLPPYPPKSLTPDIRR